MGHECHGCVPPAPCWHTHRHCCPGAAPVVSWASTRAFCYRQQAGTPHNKLEPQLHYVCSYTQASRCCAPEPISLRPNHIKPKIAHSATYLDWSTAISQTPELLALPHAHTYPHATVENDIRIHIPAYHCERQHSTPFCFASIMIKNINISSQ